MRLLGIIALILLSISLIDAGSVVVYGKTDDFASVLASVKSYPVDTQGVPLVAYVIGSFIIGFVAGAVMDNVINRQPSGVSAEVYVQDLSASIWSWGSVVPTMIKGSTTFMNFTFTYLSSYSSLTAIQYCSMPSQASTTAVKQASESMGMLNYIKNVFNVSVVYVGESARFVNYLQWRWSSLGKTGMYYSVDGSVVLKDEYGAIINPPSALSSIVVKIYADDRVLASASYNVGSDGVRLGVVSVQDSVVSYVNEKLVNGSIPSVYAVVNFGSGDRRVEYLSMKTGNTMVDINVMDSVRDVLKTLFYVYSLSRQIVYSYVSAMNSLGCPSTPLPLPSNVLYDPQRISVLSEDEKLRIYLAYLQSLSSLDFTKLGDKTPYYVSIATNDSFIGDIPSFNIYDARIYIVDFGKSAVKISPGVNVLDTWMTVLVEKSGSYYYLYLPPSIGLINDSGKDVEVYRTTVANLLELYTAPLYYTPVKDNMLMYVLIGVVVGLVVVVVLSKRSGVGKNRDY